ncbi:SpaH/EbpB family LPXTG-anchored major pilin [Actinomyces sp. Marseille-P3109]|uniref:SpaH/EbpB family LPXTG-anchored major pilin n=1 Tax=Actinomyces sp. Marseille-P3109 TaxID=2083009 RepID=UPI000D55A094|nr:SpaH/EbpB family LPXTG-anchored major pilin [Actinomyces sp. Marseille-P3109]
MKHNASTLGRRAAVTAGVLTLAVLGLAPMAQAEDANYGDIKTEALGSLTIHKHLNGGGEPIGLPDGSPVAGGPPLGRPPLRPEFQPGRVEGLVQGEPFTVTPVLQTEKGAPVSGVQFTAYPITEINLKDPAHWNKVSALSTPGAIPDSACADPARPVLDDYSFEAGMTSPDTDASGEATINSMPVKAYLVCETKTPGNIVQKAKPFVVTIPHPNTADGQGQWLYDVHVYPKNEKIEVSKTIQDQKVNGYAVGSKVRFPVTSTLPKLDDTSHYKYFQLKDTLDARLTGPTAADVTLDGAPLDDTDYQVAVDGQTVTVTFTKAGLAKLKDLPGKNVQVIFEGTVSEAGDGSINNTAQLISDTTYATTPPDPSDPPVDPNDPPTTDTVTTNWGNLTIKKLDSHDRAGSKAGLKGAEFQLFKAKESYAGTCTKEKVGDAISVDGKTTLTTDGNGTIDIKGLFVSDSIDGADRDNKVNAAERCYVLVETKAPAGFVLPSGDDAVTPVKVTVGAETTDDVTIENTKQTVPGLPLTGANGMLILTASGAALLMIAVGSVLVARYRERKQNANPAL